MLQRILYFSVIISSHFFIWWAVMVWALFNRIIADPGGHGTGALMLMIFAGCGGLLNGIVVAVAVRKSRPSYLFWANLAFLAFSLFYLFQHLKAN